MLVKVSAYTTAMEAHLARLRLEAEGVAAWVAHEHHVWANWTLSQALGGVKLLVPADAAARAAAIIADHDRGAYALPAEPAAACPRCGATEIGASRASWRLAVLACHLGPLPLPFHWSRRQCPVCGTRWSAETRAVTLTALLLTLLFLFYLMFVVTSAFLCGGRLPPAGCGQASTGSVQAVPWAGGSPHGA